MNVEISIIIPTYNGAARILKTLRSLATQTYKKFDVVVVIDGSTDNTKARILDENLNLSLVIHEQKNAGRAGSRNTGISIATGNYLIFFDDDVIVPESAVEQYHSRVAQGYSVIAGALYPVYTTKNEFSEYAGYLNDKWNSALSQQATTSSKPYLSANNFLIKKSLAQKIGGFNAVLRDAEDIEMAIRLYEMGEQIHFAADIQVGHMIQHSIAEYGARQVEYRHARKMLLQVNPASSKYLGTEYAFTGPKAAIFRLLSARFLLRYVDAGMFRPLPKNIRFRLYDILLTAYAHYGRSIK